MMGRHRLGVRAAGRGAVAPKRVRVMADKKLVEERPGYRSPMGSRRPGRKLWGLVSSIMDCSLTRARPASGGSVAYAGGERMTLCRDSGAVFDLAVGGG